MKILYFDDYKLGVLKGDKVVDVSSVVQGIPHSGPHDLINGLIANFGSYKGKLEEAVAKGTGVPLDKVKVRQPLREAVNIGDREMLASFASEAKGSGAWFHSDAVQALGHGEDAI